MIPKVDHLRCLPSEHLNSYYVDVSNVAMHLLQILKYGDFQEDTAILINYILIIGVTLHTSLQVSQFIIPKNLNFQVILGS